MKMYIDGRWAESPTMIPVISPFSNEVLDTVPDAVPEQVDKALSAAEQGAVAMSRLTAYERSQILNRAADLLAAQSEDLARTISLEEGKPLYESRTEAGRMPTFCVFALLRARYEVDPCLRRAIKVKGTGMTLRVHPVGSWWPFLRSIPSCSWLAAGSCFAAGNAVILKPARQTPLVALKLVHTDGSWLQNGPNVCGLWPNIGPQICATRGVRDQSYG
jgi:acyl-CoA reductase-like NAD-dependent aldehyde dehydrogenase